MFLGPSLSASEAARWAPTRMTGLSLVTVRSRKNAVSSRVSVPCVTITPATSVRRSSTLARRETFSQRAGVMSVLEMLEICSTSRRASPSMPGTADTRSSPLRAGTYPPSSGSYTLAMVPPVESTTTTGPSLAATSWEEAITGLEAAVARAHTSKASVLAPAAGAFRGVFMAGNSGCEGSGPDIRSVRGGSRPGFRTVPDGSGPGSRSVREGAANRKAAGPQWLLGVAHAIVEIGAPS